MHLDEWLDEKLPHVTRDLEKINEEFFFKENTIGFAGRERIHRVLDILKTALFPGIYDQHPIDHDRINILIGNNLRDAAAELATLIEKVMEYQCQNRKCDQCDFRDLSGRITVDFLEQLPEIRKVLQTDITAAYNGDPAAKFNEEIILSYPSIEALSVFRIAHFLYNQGVPVIPRIMTEIAHQKTGIDINPGAKIGKYFFIDHGTGVVIGETAVIGENVKLYQGVTLGAKSFPLDSHGHPVKNVKRHPDIEDNVVIYAGATILGGDTRIGHDSVIGGNVWLTESVPPYSTVYNASPKPLIRSQTARAVKIPSGEADQNSCPGR